MLPETAPAELSQSPEEVLTGLTLDLPPVRREDLKQMRQVGEMLYTPATLPRWGADVQFAGSVNENVTPRAAARAARLCAHNLVALARQELGTLDRVSQVMQVNVLVQCSPGFENLSRVADGASEAFYEVFGPHGRHRRTVLGTTELPESASVQVSAIFRVTSE
jgi:enamine deaminase RidA (YjgF/YER057c/UK114 family)